MTSVVGTAAAAKAPAKESIARDESCATTLSYGTAYSRSNARAAASLSRTLIPTKTTWVSSSFATLTRSGASVAQGTHQEPHTLKTTTSPRNDDVSSVSPLSIRASNVSDCPRFAGSNSSRSAEHTSDLQYLIRNSYAA